MTVPLSGGMVLRLRRSDSIFDLGGELAKSDTCVRVWARVRTVTQRFGWAAPLGVGVAGALLPCGLWYSAAMVAALAGSVTGGAAVMALFALGSGLTLWLGPWLLLRLGRSGRGAWGMRLAGLALLLTSAWGLWMGLMHDQAPWCVVPAA